MIEAVARKFDRSSPAIACGEGDRGCTRGLTQENPVQSEQCVSVARVGFVSAGGCCERSVYDGVPRALPSRHRHRRRNGSGARAPPVASESRAFNSPCRAGASSLERVARKMAETSSANRGRTYFWIQGRRYLDTIQAITNGKGVEVICEMLANVNLARDLKILARRWQSRRHRQSRIDRDRSATG